MAYGNGAVIITPEPGGVFKEGLISGTPKPGIVVEIKSISSGIVTYEPAGTTAANSTFSGMAADGNRIPIAILLSSFDHEAALNGGGKNDATVAYADGESCAVYYPQMGEEFNMYLQDITGTGSDQDFVIGLSKLMVDDGTGKLCMSSGTPESEPFIAMETKADLAADYLCRVMYTGF